MIGFIGLFDTAHEYTLQVTVTHTSDHSHVFTSCCSVVASNGGRSPSSGFPNYLWPQLPASHTNSSHHLNISSLQVTETHTSDYSHVFTSCYSVVASNGRCSPSSGFPNYLWPQLPASQTNSSQHLNVSSSLTH
jgi:hypothetical protein